MCIFLLKKGRAGGREILPAFFTLMQQLKGSPPPYKKEKVTLRCLSDKYFNTYFKKNRKYLYPPISKGF